MASGRAKSSTTVLSGATWLVRKASFSPIGGQSSLGLLSTVHSNTTSFSDFRYLNTNMSFGREVYAGWSAVAPQASALLTGALLASPEVRGSSMDIWGKR